jgi:hypothetical protein
MSSSDRRTHLLYTPHPEKLQTLCGFVLQGDHWRLTPAVQTTTCPTHVTCKRCQHILTRAKGFNVMDPPPRRHGSKEPE